MPASCFSKIVCLIAARESMAYATLSASIPKVLNRAPPSVISLRDSMAPSIRALNSGTGAIVLRSSTVSTTRRTVRPSIASS